MVRFLLEFCTINNERHGRGNGGSKEEDLAGSEGEPRQEEENGPGKERAQDELDEGGAYGIGVGLCKMGTVQFHTNGDHDEYEESAVHMAQYGLDKGPFNGNPDPSYQHCQQCSIEGRHFPRYERISMSDDFSLRIMAAPKVLTARFMRIMRRAMEPMASFRYTAFPSARKGMWE